MKYNKIRRLDIANGPGLRISIFMQGCEFKCKNCFNPETHDFSGGTEFTDETIEEIIDLAAPERVAGLSILGGEPLHPKNIEGTTRLAKIFKAHYPNKTVWIWTGFLFDKDLMGKEILQYADVIVDGRFVEKEKDLKLKYCGSRNQRVIDVKKSVEANKVVLYEDSNGLSWF